MNTITQEYLQSIFTYDNGNLYWKHNRAKNKIKAGTIAGCLDNSTYYHNIVILNKKYKAHRLIWTFFNGYLNNNLEIDHINRIRNDNRIENLRTVSRQENMFNSKAKGYSYNKSLGKFQAYIRLNGKLKTLGTFENEIEARNCYLNAKEKIHTFNNTPDLSIMKLNETIGYTFIASRNKYKAQIRVEGKNKFIGHYNTKEEAKEAYLLAKKKHLS